MGDSFATGETYDPNYTLVPYVSRYAGELATDNGVTVSLFNLGRHGLTSGQLLNNLMTNATFQTDLGISDVVTWDIGFNDIDGPHATYLSGRCGKGNKSDNQDCLRAAVATFTANWDGIVAQILSRRSAGTTIIRTMDLYDPWVAIDQTTNTTPDSRETGPAHGNDFQVFEYYLDEMNNHIAQSAAAHGILVARVHDAFNGVSGTEDPIAEGLIAPDGVHPNDAGHQLIADTFRSLGYGPLR
jgi:lysophospholipase L1-like esterase